MPLLGRDVGNCYVGGEERDIFRISSEGSGTDTFIGGPGEDRFRLADPGGQIKLIADYTPGEDAFRPDPEAFNIPGGVPSSYVAIVADFNGTDAQVPQESTRIIYDPNSGYLWADEDGNLSGTSPVHFATLLNADSITLLLDDFTDFNEI